MIIHINGRRWFQKSYGNTYHTVTVNIDGEHVFSSGQEYGYGDQYQQTAWEWINANADKLGIEPLKVHANGGNEAVYQYVERTGNKVVNTVSDVSRERDL